MAAETSSSSFPPAAASYSSSNNKIEFLTAKICELDKAIQDLEATEDLKAFGDYAERMQQLDKRKKARLLAAHKRLEYQKTCSQTDFESKIHDFTLSDKVVEEQRAYGKRRGMIKVDQFLEQVRLDDKADEPTAVSSNWLEADVQKIRATLE